MDPADSLTPRRWLLRIAATFLALLVLYVLSFGPVVGYFSYCEILERDGFGKRPPLTECLVIYDPLFSLVRDSALERPLGNYVLWWTRMFVRLSGNKFDYHF
jgi:hypothetical protein